MQYSFFSTEYEKSAHGNKFIEKKITAPKEKKTYYFFKRLFDILFSLLGIVVSIIPSVIIILLIVSTSKGPAFYRQDRLGLNGKLFQIIKFRTMFQEAENECGPIWAEKDDERITKVGMFLRKTHLDEVPQFVNVLKGEMSFVGPRPEREFFYNEFSHYIEGFDQRLYVPQGITGLAQVSGDYDMAPEKKIIYDIHYIETASLGLDFLILLKTLVNIFK